MFQLFQSVICDRYWCRIWIYSIQLFSCIIPFLRDMDFMVTNTVILIDKNKVKDYAGKLWEECRICLLLSKSSLKKKHWTESKGFWRWCVGLRITGLSACRFRNILKICKHLPGRKFAPDLRLCVPVQRCWIEKKTISGFHIISNLDSTFLSGPKESIPFIWGWDRTRILKHHV
jgi:hypothetical protein